MNFIIGADFSFSCPCLCLHSGDIFSLKNCQFYYLTDKKKFVRTGQFTGTLHSEYKSQEERIDKITSWAISHIPKNSKVFLEGYSFGSRSGLMFNIGELGGLLKHKFYCNLIEFELVPPTAVKKLATSKGNAKKDLMYSAFYNETTFDLLAELQTKVIGGNPQSDIVDSYYLAKYGFEKQKMA